MSRRRRRDCHYESNGRLPRNGRFGRKVLDQQTGLPTYEDLRVYDEWGLLVDPSDPGAYDTNEQDDFVSGRT